MMHIFILHYADDALTLRCLAALAVDPFIEETCRVFVIDNGSPTQFQCSGYPAVTVVRSEENRHLIPAFNAAMQQHPAFLYWCLNNDVRPFIGCVQKLYKLFDNPDIGIAAPGSSDVYAGILYTDPPESGPIMETRHVDNHAWVFCADVVEEIGWPDADGNAHRANWHANRDYCARARQAGYKVVAAKHAYVVHDHKEGFNAEADRAGEAWLRQKWGERVRDVL